MATTDEPAEMGQVRDPSEDDFLQRHRLKEIWETRMTLREWRRELRHQRGDGISFEAAARHYHEELKEYLDVVESLIINRYADEGGEELYFDRHIGTQVIRPPEQLAEYVEPKEREFFGLKSIIDTPTIDRVEFTGVRERHRRADEEVSGTVRVTVDWTILENAWRFTNLFLSEAGFEADIQDDEPEDGFLDL